MSKNKRADLPWEAEFSAEFGDPPWIVIRGMKLIKQQSGLWISMPGKKYTTSVGVVWENYIHIVNPEIFNELNRIAQERYYNLP